MRQEAMRWWNTLDDENRTKFCSLHYPGRNHQGLTGREIEIMYKQINDYKNSVV